MSKWTELVLQSEMKGFAITNGSSMHSIYELSCRVFIGLLLVVTFTSCERDMTVIMDGSNPPTFKLAGSGRLIFFSVFEVVPGRPSSIDDPAMWEVRPTDENLISKLPAITYGVVPAGLKQTIPTAGAPPPLIEGKVYEAGGPAFDANGGSIRFTIKGGRAVELHEKK